jgi:hypothetical protein
MPKRTFYTYITIVTLTLFVVSIMEWLNGKRIGRFMKTYEEMERKLRDRERKNMSAETKEKGGKLDMGVGRSKMK